MNIGIYIYDNVEALGFSGPYEIFSTASRLLKKKEELNVYLIAEENKAVTVRGGMKVLPNYCFADCPQLDIFIIAAGVHKKEMKKDNVLSWIKEQASKTVLTASVCSGVFLLAKSKVIKKQTVTTKSEDCEALKEAFPKLDVVSDSKFVDENSVITTAGMTAGIDMSLYLLTKLFNKKLAEQVSKEIEFEF